MAGLFDGAFGGGGGGLLGSLFGAPQVPQQSGGLLSPLADNRNAILGYLAGALQGGTLGESIGRGLSGWVAGGQQDQARAGQSAALHYAAQAPDIDPAIRAALIQNPALATQYLQSRFKQAGSSSDIMEYEYAKRQGFAGTLADWIARKATNRLGSAEADPTIQR
jgi:hypothetical protein